MKYRSLFYYGYAALIVTAYVALVCVLISTDLTIDESATWKILAVMGFFVFVSAGLLIFMGAHVMIDKNLNAAVACSVEAEIRLYEATKLQSEAQQALDSARPAWQVLAPAAPVILAYLLAPRLLRRILR